MTTQDQGSESKTPPIFAREPSAIEQAFVAAEAASHAARTAMAAANAEKAALVAELARVRKEGDGLAARLAAARNEATKHESNAATLADANLAAKADADSLAAQLAAVTQERDSMMRVHADAMSADQAMRQEFAKAEAERDELRDALRVAKNDAEISRRRGARAS